MPFPTTAIDLHPSGAESAPGTGSIVDVGRNTTLRLTLAVSAVSGSSAPTVTVSVETSPDQLAWRTVKTFSAAGAPKTEARVAAPVDRYVRAEWAFTGVTPDATFALFGVALRPYAHLGDLAALRSVGKAFAGIPDEELEEALTKACSRADNYAEDARYVLPLVEWPKSFTDDVLALAVWQLFSEVVGFNPEEGSDSVIRTRYEDAVDSLKRGSYAGMVDSTPDVDEGEAYVVSGRRRW